MNTQEIETGLRNRLAELETRLDNIKRDVRQEHSSDSAEQAQERENDEVLDQIGNETRVAINHIRAALARLEAGTYGVCEECGEAIQPGRLQAMPESTLCVNCAD